ncbi:hypothetical protein Y032_0143g2431 [Ancylostoma ceylanicum]|uniref:Uncharacterized protein n=1 Tax=Ancylostoma ceylanicum TaxID=53326 RepID=A0A016T3L1_9BILA|nr:hypothetical protein Y032_0143g2431 [Ancylostoma ceylanicum]
MQRQMLIKMVCATKSTVPPLDLPTASSAPSFRKDCTYIGHPERSECWCIHGMKASGAVVLSRMPDIDQN